MAIGRTLRFQILRRDNHTCRYCGATAPDVKLTVDHVTPVALGGSDDPSNLVTACAGCNGGKSATPPDAPHVKDVEQDALRWAKAIQTAAEAKRLEGNAERKRRSDIADTFEKLWNTWKFGLGETAPLPLGWEDSIVRFLDSGLPVDMLEAAIDTAMKNDRIPIPNIFRYMCGIAWREIADIQEAAKALLVEEDGRA